MSDIKRPELLNEYLDNLLQYIKLNYSTYGLSDEEIRYVLQKLASRHYKPSLVKLIEHSEPGAASDSLVDLMTHTKTISNRIILPFGSVYKPPSEVTSFLKDQISTLKKNRSTSKSLMLKYKAEGNDSLARYYNSDQSLQKIAMNSIPGTMGSKFSFLTDIAGFNSITSTGRYFIISAYANCERLLEGNFYFPTVDSFINHCVLLLRDCPSQDVVEGALASLSLPMARVDEVLEFYDRNHRKYKVEPILPTLYDWISRIPGYQLSYIYYYNNLVHIFQRNVPESTTYRQYIANLFDTTNVDTEYPVTSPDELFALDKDLIVVISSVYSDMLPTIDGKKMNIYDTVSKYPDIAKHLTSIGKRITNKLHAISQAISVFLARQLAIPDVLRHQNMFRSTVIASDTDSLIFTTKNWVQWYTGQVKLCPEVYQINSLIVFLLTKSNTNLMHVLARHRGATGDDEGGIQMKNEFFYPIMSLSTVKKHYTGMYQIQEGVHLPSLKSDIKGGQFRGSKLNNDTLEFTKNYIDGVHKHIITHGSISARQCIQTVVDFEKQILNSLNSGDTKYLPVMPIRSKEEYADDGISIYFNYLVWEFILASKYGSIDIPTKCYVLPIYPLNNPKYTEYLSTTEPTLLKNIEEFVSLHPNKDITRLPLNPQLKTIPEECIPLIRKRDIILDNVKPIYLYLKSLNLWTGGTSKRPVLLSEIYV